jgi:hypothetical protein
MRHYEITEYYGQNARILGAIRANSAAEALYLSDRITACEKTWKSEAAIEEGREVAYLDDPTDDTHVFQADEIFRVS